MPDETFFDLRALVRRVVDEATSHDTNSLAEEVDRLTPGPLDGELRSGYRQMLPLFVQNTISHDRRSRGSFAGTNDLREPESDVTYIPDESEIEALPDEFLVSSPAVPEKAAPEKSTVAVHTVQDVKPQQGKLRNRSPFVEGVRRYANELGKLYSYGMSPECRKPLGKFTLANVRAASAMSQQIILGNVRAKAKWDHWERKFLECRVDLLEDLPDAAMAEVLEFEVN